MSSIFIKTLYDKRWFILGWSLGMIILAVLMLAFYPAFSQDNGIADLAKHLPKQFQGLIGDPNLLKEINNYIATQLFDIRVPMFVSVLCILIGSALSVGEEESGVLRTLSGLPISRTRLLIEKWLGLVVVCICISLATGFGVAIGAASVGQLGSLYADQLLQIIIMTFLLILALGTLTLSIGLATGRKGLTTAVATIVAVGSFIVTSFSVNVSWLQPYEKLSLLHYYDAKNIPTHGLIASHILVLIGVSAVSLGVAIWCFRRRDITT